MFRNENPRPSFVRENWQNLNGKWEFEIENGKKYDDIDCVFDSQIQVPFCPESKLSGIEHKDFMTSVWYRKKINLTEEQLRYRILIHFGAVDYKATLYVNGKKVGVHKGGYISFTFDITDYVSEGENIIVVNAEDDTKSNLIPSGKQSGRQDSYGCFYTRTTGIWQTVWLEFVNKTYITHRKITAFPESKTVEIAGNVADGDGAEVSAEIFYKGEKVSENRSKVKKGCFSINAEIKGEIKLWDVLSPELYDILLTVFVNGGVSDKVKTYTGFRTIELKDGKFMLNGKPVFLRQILDQGFYPEGIYTAPDVSDIEKDIDIAISFGFNGARPHQKIFEEQYLYFADKKGYLVWGEYPNWGLTLDSKKNPKALNGFLDEWNEELCRDYNHPSIIGWCPLNEVWDTEMYSCDAYCQKSIYMSTKKYDPYRPVIGASGGNLYITDIDDYHDYSHNADEIAENVHNHQNGCFSEKKLIIQNKLQNRELLTKGQLACLPVFLSEYGGIGFARSENGWGYVSEDDEDAFVNRYVSDTKAILGSDCMGMCYTQLTDVEQEQNGLVTYSRENKFSADAIKKIHDCNMSIAKIEK